MSEALASLPPVHDHEWQLVSVESEYGVEVRESVCALCAAVTFGP
ncbi:hypothetical protein [Nocardioides sp. MH1]